MSSQINIDLNEVFEYLQSSEFLNDCGLIRIVKHVLSINPYNSRSKVISDKSTMWMEQCVINFPILYLASIYLYIYANRKGCNTFLFATRDCSHWYKIFMKMFPQCNVHYFHCSRNMLEKATYKTNASYDNYVRSIVKNDINKVIFIDVHGTCKRMFSYFKKRYRRVPCGFLLSSTHKCYNKFPEISKYYRDRGRFINLVFNARGSPCESLNYDAVGTLQDFGENGPIRDNLEYDINLIEPYHNCIEQFLDNIYSLDKIIADVSDVDRLLDKLDNNINRIFRVILNRKPVILKYINHIGKHKKVNLRNYSDHNNHNNHNNHNDRYDHNNRNSKDNHSIEKIAQVDPEKINFVSILSSETVYGLIWNGYYKGNACVIKMIVLKSGIYYDKISRKYMDGKINKEIDYKFGEECFDNENIPFIHSQFKNHKAMTAESFNHEVQASALLSNYGLGPQFYGHCIVSKNGINYGFIIMEKGDCSVKDLLLKRSLMSNEESTIKRAINRLHNEYGIIHGDLKPSNIVVSLDSNGYIARCMITDCQKIKYGGRYDDYTLQRMIDNDWGKYNMHVEKNTRERH
jgi:hypothetical protein